MVERIEDDTWNTPWDMPIPPDVAEGLHEAAIRNGRTLSEEFVYRMMVKKGMIPPSQMN